MRVLASGDYQDYVRLTDTVDDVTNAMFKTQLDSFAGAFKLENQAQEPEEVCDLLFGLHLGVPCEML